MVKYVTPREACKILQVSEKTLRTWDAEGKITATRLPNGHRRYDIDSVLKGVTDSRKTILYTRVSSHKQREDLHRQSDYLKSLFPHGEVVAEVGSGLNFKRKGLLSVLGRVMSGNVKEVVVTYSDRLVRFGIDLIRWICEQNDCQLVVLNKIALSPERELVEDILAIVHIFSCRLYGLRKYKRQIKEDSDLPR